jgi:hypothetical protein
MTYRLEPYAVVILSRSDEAAELQTRIFKVPQDFVSSIGGGPGTNALDALKAQGVQFLDGASASLLPDPSLLMVRNTPQALDEVESLIDNATTRTSPASGAVADATQASGRVNKAPVTGSRMARPKPSPEPLPGSARAPMKIVKAPEGAANTFGDRFYVADNPARMISAGPGGAISSSRAQQLLRDTELKVLLRNFETTVAEIADGEKALVVEADQATKEARAAKVNALRQWKARLVANINELTGAASTSAILPAQPTIVAPANRGIAGPAPDPPLPREVPVLSEVPILGRLFKSEVQTPSQGQTPPAESQNVIGIGR